MKYLTFLFLFLIPFSYVSVVGIRLLLLQAALGVCILIYSYAFKRMPLQHSLVGLFSYFLVFLALSYSMFSNYPNEFFSLLVFFIFLYTVIVIASARLLTIDTLLNLYIAGAVGTGIGVLVQFGFHELYGVELFNYQAFGGGRKAYGFVWADFSYLSLYLTSAIPLVFGRASLFLSIILSTVLLLSSVVTSARTGFVAFALFLTTIIIMRIISALYTGRTKKHVIFFVVGALLSPVLFMFGLESLTGRALTFSSSGRFDGFLIGWDFFSNNVLFGALLDKDFYYRSVTTIPHNIFIYMLYMGGVIFFVSFVLWFLSVAFLVRRGDRSVAYALIIVFFGFQFVPSFFSAYFVAVLLGFALAQTKLRDFSSTLN